MDKLEFPPWPDLVWTYADAEKTPPVFRPGAGVTMNYTRALRGLARQVKKILLSHSPEKAEDVLRQYAKEIGGWAKQAAANMLYGLNRNNFDMFKRQARRMGLDMRIFLGGTKTGEIISRHIENNTRLICTIPLEAAKKAGELAHDALINGTRPEEMAQRIKELGKTTDYIAKRIARTETSKAYTALTQARAQDVGSEGYIWRTGRDGAVRPSHRAMEGKFVKWSEPPTLDGMTGHAGEFPNCRCYTEPVIPRLDGSTRPFYKGLATQAEEKASGEKLFRSQWEKTIAADPKAELPPLVPHKEGEPLFNVEKAYIPDGKLAGYSLNPAHDRGGHKAKVWESAIGATARDAESIERQVLAALPYLPAKFSTTGSEFGSRFKVIVPVTGPNGKTVDVESAWIYDRLKDGSGVKTIPRMTTIFVDKHSTAF